MARSPKLKMQKIPERGMANIYRIKLAPGQIARAILSQRQQRLFNLDWIQVPSEHRNRGFGKVLMQHILRDADLYGITISLTAVACLGANQQKLEDWYYSLGFEEVGWNDKMEGPKMIREPRGLSQVV